MLQILPIEFVEVRVDYTSERLLNKSDQIVYSLYWD